MKVRPAIERTSRNEAAKATLFCPSCGYRGAWTDWCAGEGAHTLVCPDCGQTVG